MLKRLAETKKILVCVGPGGVGKTTTAAALAVVAARAGRRTLVCTIDPAPRLADALEVTLSREPRPLSEAACRALGIAAPDRLLAARLDTAGTFNALVEAQVSDPDMRRRIFANPIYRQMTTTLTGSQEYAATMALHELASHRSYDLIVLDTPPTAHALDFLDAPKRISEAIASPAVQWFARPPKGSSLFSWQRLRSGPALILRRLGKFVGSQFLDDLGAFLLDFRDVLGGFLSRAQEVEALLRTPDVGFLLVLAPELPAVNEALFFSARLQAAGLPLAGFIANRLLARPGNADSRVFREKLNALPSIAGMTPETLDRGAAALSDACVYLDRLAEGQSREIVRLGRHVPADGITTVPMLPHDLPPLETLRRIGDHLANPPPRR